MMNCAAAKTDIDRFIILVKNNKEEISTQSKPDRNVIKQNNFTAVSQAAPKVPACDTTSSFERTK